MKDNNSTLDYGRMSISRLFAKLFIPTLMGLVFSAILNIADGIFVGKGVGSDALAAVNVAAPIYLVSSGFALLFGTGVSIVAAVNLSQNKRKAANINVTLAFAFSASILAIFSLIIYVFPTPLCYLFGGTEVLEPLVVTYLRGVATIPLFTALMLVGMFVIRLDGSPQYAMMCEVITSLLNIFLDWLFVFPLQMGIFGAAFATNLSMAVGTVITCVYMALLSKNVHWCKLKFSAASLRLGMRSVGYMAKLGLSAFIGETALVCILIVGNFCFGKYLHEDGIAAFGVAAYLFPLVLMMGNAIAQSSLPIVSYNYGLQNQKRIRKALHLTIGLAIVLGAFITLGGAVWSDFLMSLFLNKGTRAYLIGCQGFPYLTSSFLFFTLNIVLIGFYQSIERAHTATIWMLLRSVVFVIPCFILLPMLMGDVGLWMAVPMSEMLTFLVIIITMTYQRSSMSRSLPSS